MLRVPFQGFYGAYVQKHLAGYMSNLGYNSYNGELDGEEYMAVYSRDKDFPTKRCLFLRESRG